MMLYASSVARRVQCPGSHQMASSYPGEDSPHAQEGKTAHWFATQIINDDTALETLANCPKGNEITPNMREGAQLLREEILKYAPREILNIEKPVDLSVIHPACKGTPDIWAVRGDTLYVWDYKFGHKYVDVYENWQLLEYAAGAYHQLNDPAILKIRLCVVQPRCYQAYPVREWALSVEEAYEYWHKLISAESEAVSDNAICKPGPECAYCPARAHCPALQTAALTALDISMSPTPLQLPIPALANELRILLRAQELLEARISGLEVEVLSHLEKGKNVPGFKIEYSNPLEKWNVEDQVLESLENLYGVDLFNKKKPITPKQALKVGIPTEVVRKNSVTPLGDKRLAMFTQQDIKKMFPAIDKVVNSGMIQPPTQEKVNGR